MAAASGSSSRPGKGVATEEEAHVADLLEQLDLTRDEGEFAALSDDEADEGSESLERAVIGKVLSPSAVHIMTTADAMRPAWGNPYGLKLRAVGEKSDNLFIAEFGCDVDKKKALGGSPWVVGKHAVVLQEYDETLKPSDVSFERMEMWVRILNLPFGWMNERRGSRAAGLVGAVMKVEADAEGKVSGPFLRARVAVEIDKPLHRGVLLKTDRNKPPEWYDLQYEKLPFFCYSCGLMGHTGLECPTPAPRNALGKLPYDLKLRAPDDRKKKLQSFGQAAAESFGSSSMGGRRTSARHGSEKKPASNDRRSAGTNKGVVNEGEDEITSPIKQPQENTGEGGLVPKPLFQELDNSQEFLGARKRKSNTKSKPPSSSDLTLLANDPATAVPSGLVSDRIALLGNISSRTEGFSEMQKKQKVANNSRARSAAVAGSDPRRAQ
ncbi:unnamed protein product [Urochloa humidicola]